MIKLSPSTVALAFRCVYAPALKRSGFSVWFNRETKRKMGAGVYFERRLTTLEDNPQAKPQEDFDHSSLSLFLESAKTPTKERIDRHAKFAQKQIDWEKGYEMNRWYDIETPIFRIVGEEDIRGVPKVHGWTERGTIDAKYVEDVERWAMQMPEKRQQVGAYEMMNQLTRKPDLIQVFDDFCTGNKKAANKIVDMYEGEPDTFTAYYLVCENKAGAKVEIGEEVQYSDPIIKWAKVDIDMNSILTLYWNYRRLAENMDRYIKYGNIPNPMVGREVNANVGKCKGEDINLFGACPFLSKCCYGRQMLETPIIESLDQILSYVKED